MDNGAGGGLPSADEAAPPQSWYWLRSNMANTTFQQRMVGNGRHGLAVAMVVVAAMSCGPPSQPLAPQPTATAAPTAAPTAVATAAPVAAPTLTINHPVATGMTVAGVTALCDDNLAIAQQLLDRIKAVSPDDAAALTWDNTLGRLDNVFLSIDNASEFPYLMGVTHPDKATRSAAQACENKTDALNTAIFLDAALAKVIKAYAHKAQGLSPERQRFLKHTLRDFRRNGLDLPAEKQARLREINKEITDIGQKFIAAIGDSKGSIEVPPAHLAGLSEAYKKKHPAKKNGLVTITTDYPDFYPFAKHARERNAAKELYIKFVNRGGEGNVKRLQRLLALRYEKAKMLGYASWADYAIEPRMAKTAANAIAFLKRVRHAIEPSVKTELKQFKAEYARRGHNLKQLAPSDRYYLTEQLRKRKYQLDSNKVAEYFEVDNVTAGLLSVTAKMYGLVYRKVDEPVWHPSVRVYEVSTAATSDGSKSNVIGKFYLDLQPRDNKYKHAAMFSVRTPKVLPNGQQQTPVAALVCNFPKPGEPMPHDQVVTYFHEFGHVLHHLLTHTELARFAGTNTVRDFVEAPSQMFEEWAWDRSVLDRFAKHPKTGKKIPAAVYRAMVNSRRLGLALATERQLYLALLDLGYHTAAPGVDTTALLKQIHQRNFSFPYVEGTHFQSSFGHLIGYDAGYYGYQWALALAYDVLSRFKKEGLMNPKTAADWRNEVLSQGGSRDETSMIHAFLGREPSEKAYADFLAGK